MRGARGMAGWYVRRGEKVLGPISSTQLKEGYAAGKVFGTDEIAKDPSGPWHEVRTTSVASSVGVPATALQSQTAPVPTATPDQLAAAIHSTSTPQEKPVEAPRVRRSARWTPQLVLLLAGVSLTSGVAGFFFNDWWRRRQIQGAVQEFQESMRQAFPGVAKSKNNPDDAKQVDWTKAGRSATAGSIEVVLTSARIGKVQIQDFRDRVGQSENEALVVEIEIRNHSHSQKANYSSWAGTSVDFGERAARMNDDVGNGYKRIDYGISKPVGRSEDGSIYPGKSATDVLVFEVPVDAAKSMRLLLPGKTIGAEKDFQLAFPKPARH